MPTALPEQAGRATSASVQGCWVQGGGVLISPHGTVAPGGRLILPSPLPQEESSTLLDFWVREPQALHLLDRTYVITTPEQQGKLREECSREGLCFSQEDYSGAGGSDAADHSTRVYIMEERGEWGILSWQCQVHPLGLLHPLRGRWVADVVDHLPNTCQLSSNNPNLLPVIESSVYIKRPCRFKM